MTPTVGPSPVPTLVTTLGSSAILWTGSFLIEFTSGAHESSWICFKLITVRRAACGFGMALK